MSDPRWPDGGRQLSPLAAAMQWVAKITTVAVEMTLPAVGGRMLDRHLGTNYWALAGLVLGVTLGMWHLIQMTRVKPIRPRQDDETSDRGSTDR